ncbi:MAG: hypothetical protein A2V66_07410 [Ignavibacteria bacterium RBG_13_36_8]|nr:MAG: hypothetical protein A2V66_07410 [Ignavibacteria bacterium RBG_13_36_8]
MTMEWKQYLNRTLNVTLFENYGVVYGQKKEDHPVFYEIVFKTGKLIAAYDDGLLLESVREGQGMKIFIPYTSIKCVEIF